MLLGAILLFSCKEEKQEKKDFSENKGIGPIKSVTLGEIDSAMAEKGKKTFETKCTSCHKIAEKYIGPALKGLTQKRSPEWIMNMVLNPEEMTRKDPTAQQLLLEASGAQMVSQNLSETEAREVLEYFRQVDSQN